MNTLNLLTYANIHLMNRSLLVIAAVELWPEANYWKVHVWLQRQNDLDSAYIKKRTDCQQSYSRPE